MWKHFKKLKLIYKYGIPFLLGVIMLTYLMRGSVFVMMFYEVIAEAIILSFCFREYYEAFRRNKCMWQIASITGVALYCILNIIYYTNNKNEEILEYQSTAFLLSCSVVIFYLIKDAYDTNTNTNKYK